MEICGPTRQRVIDIVGGWNDLVKTTSDNERETSKINGGFEMPEIQVGEP